jgi:hypothetical protein
MTDQQNRSATGPDPLPLLPRGQLVFEDIPLKALVMEALAPALRNGALIVRDRDRGAAVLVRDGALVEVHTFTGGGIRTAESVLADVQGWSDAVVSAHRFDALLVDVCESLLRGEIMYTDLHVEWVEWRSLLADFARRGGAFAIEIFTPTGRGVTCVALGQQSLAYTDTHPDLGDPALLEAMAANREGTIRVRRLNPAAFAGTTVPRPSPPAAASMGEAPAAMAEPAGDGGASDAVPSPAPQADAGPGPAAETAAETVAQAGQAEEQRRPDGAAEVLPDLTWVAPWQTPWRDELAGSDGPAVAEGDEGAPAVSEVLGDLRAVAQRRLQMSAGRVETVLDEAARERRPLTSVLDEIRVMSIRGVMPATVDAMVDEMTAVAATHRSV